MKIGKWEKLYTGLEKYYFFLFLAWIIAPNFFEPEWILRWLSVLTLCIVAIVVFGWGYYAWLILKRDPVSISAPKHLYKNLNSSQRKWHKGVFFFTMIFAAPFLIYMSSFPVVDTVRAIFTDDYVQTDIVTIQDRSSAMGTWYVGQSLQLEEKGVSDGDLLLMFSLQHALRGETYEVTYLPHSGLVLELGNPI